MANIKSSKKRAKQAVARNIHNSSQASSLRTAIKKIRKAVEDGDKDQAKAAFHAGQSLIDRIADKRIIHKNTASRYKSRLSAAVKGMA